MTQIEKDQLEILAIQHGLSQSGYFCHLINEQWATVHGKQSPTAVWSMFSELAGDSPLARARIKTANGRSRRLPR